MAKIVDIGFRIKKINDLLCKKADETMQKMGVTFSQHHTLVYLHHQKNQISSLKNMEHHFHVSQATMAGTRTLEFLRAWLIAKNSRFFCVSGGASITMTEPE